MEQSEKAELEGEELRQYVKLYGDIPRPRPDPGRMERSESELASAIAGVMAKLETLPLDGKNERFGYRYTSDTAITNALRPLLAAAGLAIIPVRVELLAQSDLKLANSTLRASLLRVVYELRHASGESVHLETVAEGTDALDKGFQKALTAAYKSMLIQLFCIGRGADADADADTGRKPAPARSAARDTAPPPEKFPGGALAGKAPSEVGQTELEAVADNKAEPYQARVMARKELTRRAAGGGEPAAK